MLNPTLAARRLAFAQALVLSFVSLAAAGPWDAPAGYYSSATGTGATLKSQLGTIMSSGHIQRTYGDFRYSAAITDRDPNNPNNILLVYDRSSVSAGWDSGSTWNREHVWPQSLQPGSASNGTSGNLGDPHALRPADPSINNSRGNSPYGIASSSGSYGYVGSYYFPGEFDKGDIARQLFYSDTRYASQGLTLVNGQPGSNEMGDLQSLITWHYADGPDEFERRRNHTIYSSAYNPQYYTNNRNAFIDHPEYVWSIYVDQANDTRLSLAGATASADGSSTREIDLGRVYVGGAAPSDVSVGLNKNGVDGTYYQVTATGDAFTDAGEYSRPVAMGSLAGTFDSFDVGLNVTTSTAGLYTGSVVVDNLDVTTGGGAGRGANDGDDTVNLSFEVLSHPVASFMDDVLMSSMTIDFGQVTLGSGSLAEELHLYNYAGAGAPTYAADLDVDSLSATGDSGVASLDLASVFGIDQGAGVTFNALLDTSVAGVFQSVYTLFLSDEDLPGEQQQTVSLTVMGEVVAPGLAGDYNGDGVVDAADYSVWRDSFGSTIDLAADGDNSGEIDAADYGVWQTNYGATTPPSLGVPEPAALLLAACGLAVLARRQR